MTEKIKNILIGLFVVTAATIMVVMVLFLEPRVGDGKKTLEVRFANISGIVLGTRVTFAGKPVGEVTAIREVKEAREKPVDDTGRVYVYQLTLKIDSRVEVYNTDEIAIRTTGLMGEKSIAILPKMPHGGETPRVIGDEVILACSLDPLEQTFSQVAKVAHRLDGAVEHFDSWFVANGTPIAESLSRLQSLLRRGDAILSDVEETHLVSRLGESAEFFEESLRCVHAALSEDHLLEKAAQLLEECNQALECFNTEGRSAIENIQHVTEDLASGDGTLSHLISGEETYLRFNSLMSKAETLMNDVNHYGLLFQYDKHWQRSRTKRANLLKSLESPQEFKQFFTEEIDSMTASLGRLTELLDRAEEERENIVRNEDFRRQFSVFMRTVQGLLDSIKLYNEEMADDPSRLNG